MNVDELLRAAGERLVEQTGDARPDLDELLQRSSHRQRRRVVAMAAAVTLVLGALGTAALRQEPGEIGLSFANGPSDGPEASSSQTTLAPTTTLEPSSSTSRPATSSTTTTTTTRRVPPRPATEVSSTCDPQVFTGLASNAAIGGGGTAGRDSRVDRYACVNEWSAARITITPEPPATFVFRAEAGTWVLQSTTAESDAQALRQAGAPLDALYRIMGLPLNPVDPVPTPPLVRAVELDQRPPEGVLAAVARQFLKDIGSSSPASTVGPTVRVYDGYLQSSTTMHPFDDDDRAAIAAVLTQAGLEIEFVALSNPATPGPGTPTLVFARPNTTLPELSADSHALYIEISGCQSGGYGADFVAAPDPTGGWLVRRPGDPVVPGTSTTTTTTQVTLETTPDSPTGTAPPITVASVPPPDPG